MTLDATQLTWDPPGGGQWEWDGSHFPGAPTPIQVAFHHEQMGRGIAAMFERYGAPLTTMSYRLVNGRVYWRLLPLIGADSKSAKLPPRPVLWLAMRVHPAFRKRTRNATAAMRDKIWRAELAHWQNVQRAEWVDRDSKLNAVDPAMLDDDDLVGHVRDCFDNCAEGHELHFSLHGTDLVPLGDLFAHCRRWGITANEAMATLQGSSPASVAPNEAMGALAKLVADAPVPSRTLDDIRALGPAASDALDAFLSEYGWRVVTGYDIEDRCLVELPDAIVRAITAAATSAGRPPAEPDEAMVAELRARVPESDRALFDELVAEARSIYGLRDDNGPLTIEWPVGLLRRAVLECGRRLAERGVVEHADHAVELELDELCQLVRGGTGPSAPDIAARAAHRSALKSFRPPKRIGTEEPEPPLDLFPAPLRRTTEIAIEATSHLDAPEEREPLVGLGIGSEKYTGRARVGQRPEEVLERMEPGDVLIAPFTNPAYNVLLSMAGAVVCQEGGALSHAAVMAREFGFPAVVGALDAMTRIDDGDMVEVDPITGRVTVVA